MCVPDVSTQPDSLCRRSFMAVRPNAATRDAVSISKGSRIKFAPTGVEPVINDLRARASERQP